MIIQLIFYKTMDNLVIFIGLFSVISLGKSDVGYRYNVPVSSYDVPFGSIGNLNNERKYYHVDKQPLAPSIQLQTPAVIPVNNQLKTDVNFDNSQLKMKIPTISSSNVKLDGGVNTNPILDSDLNSRTVNQFTGGNTQDSQLRIKIPTISSSNIKLDGGVNTNPTLDGDLNSRTVNQFPDENTQDVDSIEKHLYFFSAPEEPEDLKPRVITPQLPRKKNVKILFIKTPTFNSAPISLPVLSQNEDKTLVYVLVKKPDDASVIVPTVPPTKPTKPEVYFIKYKTEKEAQNAVENLQRDGDAGSIGGVSAIGGGDTENLNILGKFGSVSTQATPSLGSGSYGNVGSDNEKQAQYSYSSQGTPSLGSGSYGNVGSNNEKQYSYSSQATPSLGSVSYDGSSRKIQSQHTYSSDGISNFGGFSGDYSGSSTVGTFNLPTATSKISEVNVNQEYLPPRT